ncbi:hypothetical protein TRICI_002779 [Trichomonascus ciferrii]|uniref:Major facilitator superfamily (MFS) profile domain-containing protein n=1 Tax=Trichomonascus ciferrii TaxID=44093 RepID=A0A642VAU6_9ASCO|nr:hypothetical protein TRICI_002779 [Trichomonascus ciferrii]
MKFWKKDESPHDEVVQEFPADSDTEVSAKVGGIGDIEAITTTWSKRGLWIAWASISLLSVAMALDNQTLTVYTNYATASFQQQSLLSTVQIVNGVLNVVTRPPVAKIADVIGRFEGFLFSIVFLTIGFIMLAKSPNIETYFAAQIFYTIGQIGIQFMIQVFAADTSDMAHRAIFIILPNVWYLFVPWCSAPLTTAVLNNSTWRWGLGMWAIIVPVCSIPLLVTLYVNKRKSRKMRVQKRKVDWKEIVLQLDLGGSLLLAAGLALFFIAIPLADTDEKWKEARTIVMVIIGGICLILFPFYEWKVPKYPIMSMHVFKNLDISKSFVFILLYYLAFYIYNPYFFSWLMVVFNLSNSAATNVSVVSTVSSTAAGVIGAILMKFTKNVKWFIVSGTGFAMIGIGLIYKFRDPTSTVGELVAAQLIDGVGSGLLVSPNQVLVQAYCKHEEVAQTTALYLSFLALGQVIGDAVSGSVYRRRYPENLRQNVPSFNETQITTVVNDMTTAIAYPLGTSIRDGIIKSFNSVMRVLLIPPLVFFAIMFLLGLTFRDINLEKYSTNVKGEVFGKSKEEVEAENRIDEENQNATNSHNSTQRTDF